MGELDESQDGVSEKRGKKPKKSTERGRVFAFLVYDDSAPQDWIERMKSMHVRGFVSPLHDADTLADGTPKKAHRHVMWFFDGKKSRAQIDALREAALGPDFNKGLEDVACPGAYVRYLTHMDDPDKAQYKHEDVISLGGADYSLASAMPGDDTVVMAEISAYVVENDITSINSLIAVCRREGRRDWSSYISRRGYVLGMIIGHNLKRLQRIKAGMELPGDIICAEVANG